ncbi:hypothetical protein B0H14DRAFT_3124190 [Mycena olivaceomarginata]|nr:hypothetical protein B0H14DRAFT_3124190 [Mycena olivaceomarginata]
MKRAQWKAASARYYERHPEVKEKKQLKVAELRNSQSVAGIPRGSPSRLAPDTVEPVRLPLHPVRAVDPNVDADMDSGLEAAESLLGLWASICGRQHPDARVAVDKWGLLAPQYDSRERERYTHKKPTMKSQLLHPLLDFTQGTLLRVEIEHIALACALVVLLTRAVLDLEVCSLADENATLLAAARLALAAGAVVAGLTSTYDDLSLLHPTRAHASMDYVVDSVKFEDHWTTMSFTVSVNSTCVTEELKKRGATATTLQTFKDVGSTRGEKSAWIAHILGGRTPCLYASAEATAEATLQRGSQKHARTESTPTTATDVPEPSPKKKHTQSTLSNLV